MELHGPGPVEVDVPLALHTTLAVGGPARWFARARSRDDLVAWLLAARRAGVRTLVLGGGSNVVVSDAGFDGLVLTLADTAIHVDRSRGRVRAGGGAVWDALVQACVAADLAGVECLSGIPGRVGAAPIQNIGAYGQEVRETLASVEVVDRTSGRVERIDATGCGFAYRWSHFKGIWRDRYVVTAVEFALAPGGPPSLRYAELQRALGVVDGGAPPDLQRVRETVLGIRRGKSMVHDPADPNHRSAGSFFMNPVVPEGELPRIQAALSARGHDPGGVPAYPDGAGHVKLSAAALIERAGFRRGWGEGPVGLSTRHTLALVNRGGATAADVVQLAGRIRAGVRDAFGVILRPEPVFVGFDADVDAILG